MRILTLIFLSGIISFSCSSQESEEGQEKMEIKEEKPKQNGIDTDGAYREFHPNGNTKIEGFFDQKGKKNGVWKGYAPDGRQQSEIFYLDGKKNGHAVVFHPNGKPKYIGEYKDDIKIGNWRFYDMNGNITKEVDFDESK